MKNIYKAWVWDRNSLRNHKEARSFLYQSSAEMLKAAHGTTKPYTTPAYPGKNLLT